MAAKSIVLSICLASVLAAPASSQSITRFIEEQIQREFERGSAPDARRRRQDGRAVDRDVLRAYEDVSRFVSKYQRTARECVAATSGCDWSPTQQQVQDYYDQCEWLRTHDIDRLRRLTRSSAEVCHSAFKIVPLRKLTESERIELQDRAYWGARYATLEPLIKLFHEQYLFAQDYIKGRKPTQIEVDRYKAACAEILVWLESAKDSWAAMRIRTGVKDGSDPTCRDSLVVTTEGYKPPLPLEMQMAMFEFGTSLMFATEIMKEFKDNSFARRNLSMIARYEEACMMVISNWNRIKHIEPSMTLKQVLERRGVDPQTCSQD